MQFERFDLSLEREHSLPKLSFSSRVLPELVVALDTAVVLGVAFISFEALLGGQVDEPANYAAAVGFVWLTSILLMNFAGLYRLEPIMRPLAFFDKFAIAFITTFLFLLAAAFSIKISESFSRVWVASFAISAYAGTVVCPTRILHRSWHTGRPRRFYTPHCGYWCKRTDPTPFGLSQGCEAAVYFCGRYLFIPTY